VREVFVSLYEKGLIYRGNRIINWCPRCQTALSDIEVEHEDSPGALYYVRYPLKDAPGEYITVATTRPETILGDTGVAVHPDDGRYKNLVGKLVVLPLVGREIPVVADEYVDPSFGTGAVKVTPAHDPNDFEMGLRHNLAEIAVIGPDGTMSEEAGRYAVMDRYACRKALVEDLKAGGFLVKIDEHVHAVGHCQRCDTVIEPLVSKQWFVRMKPLAGPAIEAVASGRIKFVPERFAKVYINWLENIRDWCISRQLWWGHRIPAWYCSDCGEITVSRHDVDRCAKCGGAVEQDPDVLDTWFSSALWPFSTMGWPEKTPELRYFYPTSVLVTGYDIIFFWVARMIFMGLEFTGDIPFRYVFIHGLVRDAEGRKMSKSLGNGIDPLDVIEKYGADTLRFTLLTGNTPGNDMRFYWERVESSRNFANKIWNASRFVMLNLAGFTPQASPQIGSIPAQQGGEQEKDKGDLADRWIMSRYNQTVAGVTDCLERFELGEAARLLYEFIWNEFCDWYIELAKLRLYDKADQKGRAAAQQVLWQVLRGTLELLHPFMPFITEAVWQHLPHAGSSIMTAPWPAAGEKIKDPAAEAEMSLIVDTIKAIRNMRAEVDIKPGRLVEVAICAPPEAGAVLSRQARYVKALAGAQLSVLPLAGEKPANALAAVVSGGVEIYLPLKGVIDIDREIARLDKELKAIEADLARLEGKLANSEFLAKAPRAIVEKEESRRAENREKAAAVRQRIAQLSALR